MEDLKTEMRDEITVQFCVRLEESPSSTYVKMQLRQTSASVDQTSLSGIKCSRRATAQQLMIQDVNDY